MINRGRLPGIAGWSLLLFLFESNRSISPTFLTQMHGLSTRGRNHSHAQERLRNFIDRRGSQTLRQIKEEVLATTLAYVSNSDFEARFVAKRYREWSEELRTEQARFKTFS
jgi:hypothetical protein